MTVFRFFLPIKIDGIVDVHPVGDHWLSSTVTAPGHFLGDSLLGSDGQQWIATWVDDQSYQLLIYEGQKRGDTLTLSTNAADLPGHEQRIRVDVWSSNDAYISHFFKKPAHGSATEFMAIAYTRIDSSAKGTMARDSPPR